LQTWQKTISSKNSEPGPHLSVSNGERVNNPKLYDELSKMKQISFFNTNEFRRMDVFKWVLKMGSMAFVSIILLGSTRKKPSDDSGLLVPDGFEVERVVSPELHSYPMFASFDGQGRMFVFESTEPNVKGSEHMLKEPSYHVRLLEDIDGDGIYEKSKVFAKGIPFPKGGAFFQGSLYVAESPNLTKYTDTDGDGVADKKEIILSGWKFHANGATLSGPFFGPDGWLYLPDARRGFNITTKEGNNLSGKATRIWRCRPDGTGLEALAGGGFDNSIEIAFMPSGETIGTMTYFVEPSDGQRDALMHWVEGGTYPKPGPTIAEDGLKLTGDLMPVMTKMPRVAPAGLMRFKGAAFGPGYHGNLFHAEFNTGRIMRHIVTPEGATYTTQDEAFIKSLSGDSHLTDVLQDADGSMLVVATGGWFIEGCPLSRVAKPDVKGGIFRIRKKGASRVSDPWGRKINMKTLATTALTKYLRDPRPAVRENAIEELVLRGGAAVAPIVKALPSLTDVEFRAAAVFALSRIHTEASVAAVRTALDDKNPIVRTAAVRALGLAKDQRSLAKLMKMVVNDQPAVRRQAATALGQIGDVAAVPALLTASSNASDRFLQHAIVHSLIILKTPGPLVAALQSPSSKTKVAALIALDQMEGSPLKKEQLSPVLASTDLLLRDTGIWIASHHAQWTDIIVSFLEKNLTSLVSSGTELTSVRELMLTFIKEKDLQQFVTTRLRSAPKQEKLFLLDVIGQSPIKELPVGWIGELGHLLGDRDEVIRAQVLGLIESRRLVSLKDKLNEIVQNENGPVDFRLKALSARIMTSPQLSATEFAMLEKYIGPSYDSPVRQLAVRLLNHADLNAQQLLSIAQNQVGQADQFLLPSLIEAFEGNKDETVGKALVTALKSGAGRLDNISEPDMRRLLKNFPQSVQSQAEPLIAQIRTQHAERLAHLQKMEVQMKGGDVGEGRKLFFGKASCYSCHAVGKEGGRFGPDLTNIGEIRSKHDILEAVVYPSASFAREYETFRVVTKTTAYTGVIKEQLPEAIVIEVGPAPGLRIPRSEITAIEPQTLSMMPPGLDQQLTTTEMANLTAFLVSLPYSVERIISASENK
jgi:putative membrane-bound dehydrogenase-like protein